MSAGGSGREGGRALKTRVKTARKRSLSSTLWLERQLNDPFVARAKREGFRSRAAVLEAALQSPDVAFVLVTSPSPSSIQEVLYFEKRLRDANMPRGAFVVNRVHERPEASDEITEASADAALKRSGLELDYGAPARFIRAYEDATKLAQLDTLHLRALDQAAGEGLPVVRVPELPTDVHDARGLVRLSSLLLRGSGAISVPLASALGT